VRRSSPRFASVTPGSARPYDAGARTRVAAPARAAPRLRPFESRRDHGRESECRWPARTSGRCASEAMTRSPAAATSAHSSRGGARDEKRASRAARRRALGCGATRSPRHACRLPRMPNRTWHDYSTARSTAEFAIATLIEHVYMDSMAQSRQRDLVFRTWGGKRAGAGRKRVAARPQVPHRRRRDVHARHPVLVTTRVVPEVGRLRTEVARRAIEEAMASAMKRGYADSCSGSVRYRSRALTFICSWRRRGKRRCRVACRGFWCRAPSA
jgi:hypothetical protein